MTRVFRSTDASAPVLTGQTGSLIAVLDSVLVNGYGSQTAAGWAKSFSGTSKAAYRPAGGNQFYLRVQDDGPGLGTFKEARIVGYESMSAVDTGSNPFPTAAQLANGMFVRKSASADSVARAWFCIAEDRTVYFGNACGDAAGRYYIWGFGDFYAKMTTTDGYRTFIQGRVIENSSSNGTDLGDIDATFASTPAGCYMARNRLGTVGALSVCKISPGYVFTGVNISGGATAAMAYPNAEDGGLYVEPMLVGDKTTVPANSIRGQFRGLWFLCHPHSAFNDGDVFQGVGDLAGKSFVIAKTIANSGNNVGALAFETNTWDAN